jgi:hypothetical protein
MAESSFSIFSLKADVSISMAAGSNSVGSLLEIKDIAIPYNFFLKQINLVLKDYPT